MALVASAGMAAALNTRTKILSVVSVRPFSVSSNRGTRGRSCCGVGWAWRSYLGRHVAALSRTLPLSRERPSVLQGARS